MKILERGAQYFGWEGRIGEEGRKETITKERDVKE